MKPNLSPQGQTVGPVASECRFCGNGAVVSGICATCGRYQSGYRFIGKKRKKKTASRALEKAAAEVVRARQAACGHEKTDEGRESWLRGQRAVVRTCVACGTELVTVEEEVSE